MARMAAITGHRQRTWGHASKPHQPLKAWPKRTLLAHADADPRIVRSMTPSTPPEANLPAATHPAPTPTQVFMDDVWDAFAGPSEASEGLVADAGLTPADVAEIAAAWATAAAEVRAAVAAAGGWAWQAFYNNGTNPDDLVRVGRCAEQLRA